MTDSSTLVLIVRPAMLLRRKVYAAALIFAILFLMLASQSIQRRHLLPLLSGLPVSRATPTGRETGEAGKKVAGVTGVYWSGWVPMEAGDEF